MTALALGKPPPASQEAPSLDLRTFRKLADVLYAESGIEISEAKLSLMFSRLLKRLRALNIESFERYHELISSENGQAERENMIYALTTNFTKFFREPHHFEYLRAHLEDGLVQAARRGDRVRLWCAAASTGEEPYSIAMTVLDALPDAARLDVKILATDIDSNVLQRAAAGVYTAAALQNVPVAIRRSHFTDLGNGAARVSDELKSLLSFKKLNLIRPLPIRGPFDVVFCRNVAIYFNLETQKTVWTNILSVLGPGAHLYIGHSERIGEYADDVVEASGITSYIRT